MASSGAAIFVLTGSAVLLLALGGYVAARVAGHRWLGVALAAFGLGFVVSNLAAPSVTPAMEPGPFAHPLGLALGEATVVVSVVASLLQIGAWARREGGAARVPLLLTAASAAAQVVTWTVLTVAYPVPDAQLLTVRFGGLPPPAARFLAFAAYAVDGLALLAAYAAGRVAVRADRLRPDLPLVLGMGLFACYANPQVLAFTPSRGSLDDVATLVFSVSFVLVPVGALLVAAARWESGGALVVAASLAGVGLLGLVLPWFVEMPGLAFGNDELGVRGIVRTTMWAALVHGILRRGTLERPVLEARVGRTTLVAGALATLFIAAQIAQNYLSDAYGLLLGGVVAGAFLFAASPLQRALERLSEGSTRPPARAVATSTHEEVYKSAVRLALRGGIDPREEVELMRIADAHGISHLRAAALRREVQGEREPRP